MAYVITILIVKFVTKFLPVVGSEMNFAFQMLEWVCFGMKFVFNQLILSSIACTKILAVAGPTTEFRQICEISPEFCCIQDVYYLAWKEQKSFNKFQKRVLSLWKK